MPRSLFYSDDVYLNFFVLTMCLKKCTFRSTNFTFLHVSGWTFSSIPTHTWVKPLRMAFVVLLATLKNQDWKKSPSDFCHQIICMREKLKKLWIILCRLACISSSWSISWQTWKDMRLMLWQGGVFWAQLMKNWGFFCPGMQTLSSFFSGAGMQTLSSLRWIGRRISKKSTQCKCFARIGNPKLKR